MRLLAPLPMPELRTISVSEVFSPSRCRPKFVRAFQFHSGSMRAAPMVPSGGRWTSCTLAGLNGSTRPGPQSGTVSIHQSCRFCSSRPERNCGMTRNLSSSRSRNDSGCWTSIAGISTSGRKRSSLAAANRKRK